MTFFGVESLVDPDVSDAAVLFVLIGVGFVPAIWVSIRPSNIRQRVQKSTVVACLGLVFFGAVVAGDVLLPMIMMPATTLLAIASGLIFQRSPKSG